MLVFFYSEMLHAQSDPNSYIRPAFNTQKFRKPVLRLKVNQSDDKFVGSQLWVNDMNDVRLNEIQLDAGKQYRLTGVVSIPDASLVEITGEDDLDLGDLFIRTPSKKIYRFLLDNAGQVVFADSSYYKTVKQLKESGINSYMPFYSPGVFAAASGLAFTSQHYIHRHYSCTVTFLPFRDTSKKWTCKLDSASNPYLLAGDSNVVFITYTNFKAEQGVCSILSIQNTANGEVLHERRISDPGEISIPYAATFKDSVLNLVYAVTTTGNTFTGIQSIRLTAEGLPVSAGKLNDDLKQSFPCVKKGIPVVSGVKITENDHYVITGYISKTVADAASILVELAFAVATKGGNAGMSPTKEISTGDFEIETDMDLHVLDCKIKMKRGE